MDNVTNALAALHAAVENVFGTLHNPCGSSSVYDRHITGALASFLPGDRTEAREFIQRVRDAARKADTGRPLTAKWTPYTYIAVCLDTKAAWMTPGFTEARAYNNLYGS